MIQKVISKLSPTFYPCSCFKKLKYLWINSWVKSRPKIILHHFSYIWRQRGKTLLTFNYPWSSIDISLMLTLRASICNGWYLKSPVLSKAFQFTYSLSSQLFPLWNRAKVINAILQLRKLMFRQVKGVAGGHVSCKQLG